MHSSPQLRWIATAPSDAKAIPGDPPSEDPEIFEAESAACSPLLLSCPGFSTELLDLDPPGGEFISDEGPCFTQEPGRPQVSRSEYAPVAASPSEIPLLLNPDCSSLLATSSPGSRYRHDLGRTCDAESDNVIQPPGSPSLRNAILSLGEEVISASQLHRLSREVQSTIVWLEYRLTSDNLSQDLSAGSLPQECLETSFNALIDASDALSLRRSIILTDIGTVLEQVTAQLRDYLDDGEMLSSINESIQIIEEEDQRRKLRINFYALQNHRSTSSSYGSSFLQQNRLIFLRTQKFLASTAQLRHTAAAFIADPMSIMNTSSPCIRLK